MTDDIEKIKNMLRSGTVFEIAKQNSKAMEEKIEGVKNILRQANDPEEEEKVYSSVGFAGLPFYAYATAYCFSTIIEEPKKPGRKNNEDKTKSRQKNYFRTYT